MLSKSRGLVVRLAAVLHILFSAFPDDEEGTTSTRTGETFDEDTADPSNLPVTVVSEAAVEAAINFIWVSCQQTAFCAGRGTLEEELMKFTSSSEDSQGSSEDEALAAFALTLPGKTLFLTPLLSAKKFRNRGRKDDVVRTFYQLEEEGLGKTLVLTGSKGATQQFEFVKASIPGNKEEKIELMTKLRKYNISLTQYESALKQKEIQYISPGAKRKLSLDAPTRSSPRKSPRKSPQQ